ncbi:arylalkylamine N-acetyltransferase 1 [Nomia melanderi]|uniref:arylalkylamine N-acetyltransferase 1 n=1 Tax=Nomia melanderi TaxID=2448451 RepID=UPI003FCE5265
MKQKKDAKFVLKPVVLIYDDSVYITRLALPSDYENVADFMSDVYYRGEPAILNIGTASATAPKCWRRMMYDQVKYGLSIIAEDRDRYLIGASLNTVIYPSEPEKILEYTKTCESPAMKQILHFFSYVVEQSRIFERFCVPRMFELTSLAVSEDYRNMGIGRRLIMESWYLARSCGYPMVYISCDSSHCAKICMDLGWQNVWSMPFDQYVLDGEVVFKHVKEPNTLCRLFINKLKDGKI